MPPTGSAAPLEFETDFRQTMQRLRASLTECLDALRADPGSPRALGRQLDLDKSLAWKVAQIARPDETDTVKIARQLPGPAGRRLVVEALRKQGAPDAPCDRLEQAFESFHRLVEVHGGNRAGMDVLLASLAVGSPDARGAETARKQAFQGNSAIWGVQVRLRLGLHVVKPADEDPDRVTLATVAAHYDFRRLRDGARWPLVQVQPFGEGIADIGERECLDPSSTDGNALMTAFCSEDLPPLEQVAAPGGGHLCELADGPIGRAGAQTFVFGSLHRGFAPVRGETPGEYGEHVVTLNTPAEGTQVDLLLHRDLPFPGEPTARMFSKMETGAPLELDLEARYELPIAERLVELPTDEPLAAGEVPRYTELVDTVLDRMGTPLEDYRAWRFEMKYPPIPCVAAVRHSLAPPRGR